MGTGWTRIGLGVAFGMVAASCGGGSGKGDLAGTFDRADTAVDPGADPISGELDGGVYPGDGPDPGMPETEDLAGLDLRDASDTGPEPVVCAAGEACNAWLHPDGTCPGRCIPQVHAMTCEGQVFHGLCYRIPPPERSNEPAQFGPLLVTPVEWPEQAESGETHVVRVMALNTGTTPLDIPFSFKHPDTWEVVSATFDGWSSLVLAPSEEVALEARMRAVRPDVFDAGGGVLLTFDFGGESFDLYSSVVFGPDEPIECGGYHFPASWCPDGVCAEMGHFYYSARCCGDVFFPGAMCCSDEDCIGGSCVDGRCLTDVPSILGANNIPIGNQRILLVLADFEFPRAASPCLDRVEEARAVFLLDDATDYLRDVVRRRVQRDLVAFRWTVLAGLASDDFIKDGNYLVGNYLDRLDEYLAAQGCETFDRFDKVVVASPRMDLQGWGGQALDRGRVAVQSPANPYLLAHEIAHTFGASDLYLDLGGQFQYLPALMANNTDRNMAGLGPPGDDVMWGEMGLDDVDRDGVVDLMQFAAFPESLEVASLTATLTNKQTLEVGVEFAGRENGVSKRVVLSRYRLEMPGLGVVRDVIDPHRVKVVAFGGDEVDLTTLASWQVLDIRVSASFSFTTRDWDRKTLDLDRTFTVPIGKPRPGE